MIGSILERFRPHTRAKELTSVVVRPEPPKPKGPKPEIIRLDEHPLGGVFGFFSYAGKWNAYALSEERLSAQERLEAADGALEEQRVILSDEENLFMLRQSLSALERERAGFGSSTDSKEYKQTRRRLRTVKGQYDRGRERVERNLQPFKDAVTGSWMSLRSADKRFALGLGTLQELAFFIADRMQNDPIGKENLIAEFVTKAGFNFNPTQLIHINNLLFDYEIEREGHWAVAFGRERERTTAINSARQTEIIKRIVKGRLIGTLLSHSQNPQEPTK